MPPFPSLYRIIVTPVVAILSNLSVLDSLKPNPGEVDDIFDHPLEACPCMSIARSENSIRFKAFLDPTIMNDEPKLSPPNSDKWPYPEELWVCHIVDAYLTTRTSSLMRVLHAELSRPPVHIRLLSEQSISVYVNPDQGADVLSDGIISCVPVTWQQMLTSHYRSS
jgi:hypothetical protein